MTQLDRLKQGLYYNSRSAEIGDYNLQVKLILHRYNQLPQSEKAEREAILRGLFGSLGKNPYIENTFQCDMGFNLHAGDNLYCNHNCVFLDCAPITIGDDVLFGPNVGIYTPEHAFDPTLRKIGWERSLPVTIGDRVWVGGSVTILGGVTIGSDTIIGAGSVVTHDIPSGVIAVGNPCRVLREISEEDKRTHSPQDL